MKTIALTAHQPIALLTEKFSRAAHLLWLCMLLSIVSAAGAETVVWQDNFDDGNGDNRWSAEMGVWRIGSPTVGPPTNSLGYRTYSGHYCATTGLNGNYLPHQDSRFIRIASFVVPDSTNSPR